MIYRSLLGRAPSPSEADRVRGRLGEGAEIDAIADELAGSEEGLARTVRRGDAALLSALRSDWEPPARSPRRLVFLHIMKVGGTSLCEMMFAWVPPGRAQVHIFLDDLVLQPRLVTARLQVIAGHVPFEALTLVPGSYSTMCVLRDPLQRTLSHYAELRRSVPRFADLTLARFLDDDLFAVPRGNYQARQLAHTIGVGQAWVDFSPLADYVARGGDPADPRPVQALFDSTPVRLDDAELLATAAGNLARIDLVGTTDDLARVGREAAAHFGLPPAPVPRLNVTPSSVRTEVPASARRRIDELTAVDRELYEAARRRSR